MKKLILFSLLFSVSVIGLSQSNKSDQVRVSIKGADSTFLVNTIDLIGSWKNIASAYPIPGITRISQVVEITNGNLVTINDAWTEDYPNKLKNCTWKIVDNELQFHSPDLGNLTIDVEKLKGSSFFELTVNNFTYRKLINLSDN